MVTTLISLVIFGAIYYLLWSLWCRCVPDMLAPDAPDWVKRPNFVWFFFVTMIVLLIYRNLGRKS